jgi:SARP family transcriptional regulator, regulator of embCAB operon
MLRITLFGSTRVERDGQHWHAAALGGVKQRQLLEMLATNLGTPVPKDRLAERLWDGQPPPSYVATLESYICVLRRRLGVEPGSLSALATTNKCYVLDPGQVEVDLVEVTSTLASMSPADVLSTLDGLPGDLLASEPYAGWADAERDKFAQLVASVCTGSAHLALEAGCTASALRLAHTAVQQNYFSEAARRELMHALWLSGEGTQALAAYAELRARMLDDLGMEPGPVSQKLYLDILRGSEGQGREQDRLEVTTLIRLLRQALESSGRTDVLVEPNLLQVARMLLAQALSTQPVAETALAA